MGATTRSETLYCCDRCKHETTNPYDKSQQSNIRVHMSGIGYTGDVGGATLHYWLCGECTREFQQFMKNAETVVPPA